MLCKSINEIVNKFLWLLLRLALLVLISNPAWAQSLVKRDLVVVPGILGSKLCSPSEEIIWGDLGSLSDFQKLEITGDVNETSLHSCGPIEQIQVLGPFFNIRAYKPLFEHLESKFGASHNILKFHYDWRRSNFSAAEQLSTFIAENTDDSKAVDILAHSMGGIVTRIYLKEFRANQPIQKVVYFGTPFIGSMVPLGTLAKGWGALANRIAGGMDGIRRVVISFPAILELLPRYKNAIRIVSRQAVLGSMDPFNPDQWVKFGFLPKGFDKGSKFELFKNNLEVARSLNKYLFEPIKDGPEEYFFAGSAHDTLLQLRIPENPTRPENWIFSKSQGDGTVPVWSAAADHEMRTLRGSYVSFGQHATLFDDNGARVQLERILLDHNPGGALISGGNIGAKIIVEVEGTSHIWTTTSISLELDKYTTVVDENITGKLKLRFVDDTVLVRGLYSPKIYVSRNDVKNNVASVVDATTDKDFAENLLVFDFSTQTGPTAGVDQIIAELSPLAKSIAYVGVLKKVK